MNQYTVNELLLAHICKAIRESIVDSTAEEVSLGTNQDSDEIYEPYIDLALMFHLEYRVEDNQIIMNRQALLDAIDDALADE